MNPIKSIFAFLTFLAIFCSALALRYHSMTFQKSLDSAESWPLYTVLLLSGIALGFSFHFLKVKAHSTFMYVAAGIGCALLVFTAVSAAEDEMSDSRFLMHTKPSFFGVLDDHCGVYAGRTLLKIFHLSALDTQIGMIKEFELNSTCRLRHFSYLAHQNPGVCNVGEDAIACRIRWMGAFSDHGIWNYQSRKFFFNEVMNAWPNSKNEESLVAYVAKNQDLESGRQSLLKQAGVEEEFSDHFLILQQRDLLDNLRLTQKIFAEVTPKLTEVKNNPPPYLLKFKDMLEEVMPKLEKIPELEKDLAGLKKQ